MDSYIIWTCSDFVNNVVSNFFFFDAGTEKNNLQQQFPSVISMVISLTLLVTS